MNDTDVLKQIISAPDDGGAFTFVPELDVLKRSHWAMFPWLYNGYTQLLSRVHRLGGVGARGQAIHPLIDNPAIIGYFQSTSYKTQDETKAWCSAFVNWCFSRAGVAGTRSAAARSWLDWHGGRQLSILQPVIGSVVVFPRGHNGNEGHVAMVWNIYSDASIDVLGGNQGARGARPALHQPGISSHVSIAHHKCNEALGYVWPRDYPIPDSAKAKDLIHLASLAIPSDLHPGN